MSRALRPASRRHREGSRGAWLHTYRLTLLYALVSLIAMGVVAVIVNAMGADLAEANLVRLTEENAVREGEHILSMVSAGPSMEAHSDATNSAETPLTLESLLGPDGLQASYPMLVDQLHIPGLSLFAPDGRMVWSAGGLDADGGRGTGPRFPEAATGVVVSKLLRGHTFTDPQGAVRRLDVVQTYLPVRDAASGRWIGTLAVYRDVGDDVILQVDQTKATILRLTVGAVGGLFLSLSAFVVVADRAISRSNRREMALVQEQLRERQLAAEALQATQERLRAVIDNAPIIAFAADRQGVFTLVEGRGLRAFDGTNGGGGGVGGLRHVAAAEG